MMPVCRRLKGHVGSATGFAPTDDGPSPQASTYRQLQPRHALSAELDAARSGSITLFTVRLTELCTVLKIEPL
jgi:hypothetical protein